MSKRFRNKYARSPRDFYRTPLVSVIPLIPHLRAAGVRTFSEPCVGQGDLLRHLESFGLRCGYRGDIETGQDALAIEHFDEPPISNPPFSQQLGMIEHFMRTAPFTWLLLMDSFGHNKYARPYLPHCSDIVAAGREAWFQTERGKTGTEEVCWFRFSATHRSGPVFHNGESGGSLAIICSGCSKPFRPVRSDARTCSDRCRQRAKRARLTVTEV